MAISVVDEHLREPNQSLSYKLLQLPFLLIGFIEDIEGNLIEEKMANKGITAGITFVNQVR